MGLSIEALNANQIRQFRKAVREIGAVDAYIASLMLARRDYRMGKLARVRRRVEVQAAYERIKPRCFMFNVLFEHGWFGRPVIYKEALWRAI